MPKLTIRDMKKMRDAERKRLSLREGDFKGKVTVHLGTCGIAAGAREIMMVLVDEFEEKAINDIMFTTSGCAGLCSQEPMITVEMQGTTPIKYGNLTKEKTRKIIVDHILMGNVVTELAMGRGSERVG